LKWTIPAFSPKSSKRRLMFEQSNGGRMRALNNANTIL
jgi:hypothetical protein